MLLVLLAWIPISIGLLSPTAQASEIGEVTPRIIGGTEAPADSWPSQVALLNAAEPNAFQAQFCGGTLIDEGWVLTAAHCVDFLTSPSQIRVAIGINDLDTVSSGDRKAVGSIVIHPDWNSVYDWDFALLELVTPSDRPVTDLIAPAEVGETVAGKPARIAGWGCTVIGTREDCFATGFLPELREATVAFISDSTCQSSWPFDFDPVMMVCAGIYPGGGIDTCIGDSGGPMTALVDGRRVLAGVTSWGSLPCGVPNAPGVYARVLAARDWILGTMAGAFGLTVSRSGSGQGTVASDPAGIDCGTTCEATFEEGQTVGLTATAAEGSTFTGWSGDCSGTGTCEVTMSEARSVVAAFSEEPPPPLPLTVNRAGTGQGTITSSPAGIGCGSACLATFPDGAAVELTATAAEGSAFTGWSGDCSGTGTCEVTMDRPREVTAEFTEEPPPPPQPTAPAVTITAKPAKRTAKAVATFRFRSSQSGSTFRCRLDGKKWGKCSSPKAYRNLKRGRKHTFRVKATKDGLTGPVARYTWYVKRR